MRICEVTDCDRPTHGKGMCRPHLRRANKGLPLDVVIRRNSATDTMEDRFRNSVVETDHGLEWIGARTGNYGALHFKGKHHYAHRAAWMLFRGPIPDGMQVDHLPECPRTCVTVDHLSLMSCSEHTITGWERGELGRSRTADPRELGAAKVAIRPKVGRVVHDG